MRSKLVDASLMRCLSKQQKKVNNLQPSTHRNTARTHHPIRVKILTIPEDTPIRPKQSHPPPSNEATKTLLTKWDIITGVEYILSDGLLSMIYTVGNWIQ